MKKSRWTFAGRALTLLFSILAGPLASGGEPAPDLDRLLRSYRSFGLPMPPASAPLVAFPTGWKADDDVGKQASRVTLGFLLKAADEKNAAEILYGSAQIQPWINPKNGKIQPVKGDSPLGPKTHFVPSLIRPFEMNPALLVAIQLHARKKPNLAASLLRLALEQDDSRMGPTHVRSSAGPWQRHQEPVSATTKTADPALRLATLAWAHWLNQIYREKTDWKTVESRLRQILAAAPALQDPARKGLLDSITATRAAPAATGVIESEIAALVESGSHGGDFQGEPSPEFLRLQERGFEAVPALIKHLNDRRLTRSLNIGFNNFPTMPRRLGEIVSDLLGAIAGGEIGRAWLDRQQGRGAQRAAVLRWWRKAKAQGEEAYASRRAVITNAEGTSVNAAALTILSKRYPARLPKIYREVLAAGKLKYLDDLTEALVRSGLTTAEKVELLQLAVASPNLGYQVVGLRHLRQFDTAATDQALLRLVEKLPLKIATPVWTSPESRVSHLVMETPSVEIWSAFAAKARQAHISLRMEWMNPLNYHYAGDLHRELRLRFLATFLPDKTVRDLKADPVLYQGPCAGFHHDRFSVQNLAAEKIASMLGLPDKTDSDSPPSVWAELVGRVKKAVLAAGIAGF